MLGSIVVVVVVLTVVVMSMVDDVVDVKVVDVDFGALQPWRVPTLRYQEDASLGSVISRL